MPLTAADLHGVFPALVTPFHDDGSFDPAGMVALVDRMFDAGATGIVPLGGTGEYTALSTRERQQVLESSMAATKGRGPVVAGVLSPGFEEAAETAKAFARTGADALMVVTPFYVLSGQQGILDYYRRLRDTVDLPIVLYDIPSRTNVSYAPETVATLAEEGVAIGIKYSNFDVVKFTRVMIAAGDKMTVMAGDDSLLVPHMALGSPGTILATANLCPALWVECFRLAAAGDFAKAAALQMALYPMMDAVFSEPNPTALKKAMAMYGVGAGPVRLPLTGASAETEKRLREVLQNLPQVGKTLTRAAS